MNTKKKTLTKPAEKKHTVVAGRDGAATPAPTQAIKTPPVSSRKTRGTPAKAEIKPSSADDKPTRLTLIKTRHESMKREIDQIREDLESDEEE